MRFRILTFWILFALLALVLLAAPEWVERIVGAVSPITIVALSLVIAGALFLVERRRTVRARSQYLRALQASGPEPLVDFMSRSASSARLVADLDAYHAHAKSLALAFYGREADALGTLAEIDWKTKGRLAQAAGLNGESIIELLCRRNPGRALELSRGARALATPTTSAQAERYYVICVAACEAVSNGVSPSGLRLLEAGAADGRFPTRQLLARFGLAAAMDRSGNSERARQLRESMLLMAPHCAPLQLMPAQLPPTSPEAAAGAGPVSSSLPAAEVLEAEAARRPKPLSQFTRTVILWLVLIGMFWAVRALLR